MTLKEFKLFLPNNTPKIIKKLEDLDGLENGMGLKVFFDKNDCTLSVGEPWKRNIINRIDAQVVKEVEYFLKSLRYMGFEFEYQPLRSLEEVKKEIQNLEGLPFKQKEINYYVHYNNLLEMYFVYNGVNERDLNIYMSKELAQKYADELNEIIGSK